MKLRDYQLEISNAVLKYLLNEEGNPLAASPGGTGKSLTMNHLIKKLVTKWEGTRVMSLVHDAKVIGQNYDSMMSYWKDAPAGIYSAGLKRRDTTDAIIFGGIQSVAKRAYEFGKINILFIDECDLLSPKEETLYQRFIQELKQANPLLRVVGFTATPYRLGMGCLTNMDLWDKLVIDFTKTDRFNRFITEGMLAPLVSKRTSKEIDITDVSMKGGEFDEKSLAEVADTDELNKCVVEECLRYGHDRNHWLVFSSGVKHGEKLAKLFRAAGVTAVMLSGSDSVKHREEQEALFRSGEVRCLINCGLYGRGWNFPELDMIAWARATQSVALWVQGCVRGTRTSEGKRNCLVLDFAGNTRRLGHVNEPVVPAPRRKGDAVKGEAPVKECPQCHSYLHTRTMVCPDCEYVFPPPKTLKKHAGTDDILKGVETPVEEDFDVNCVRYRVDISKAGNRYMRATYGVGVQRFHEFLFFDGIHQYQRKHVSTWWRHRGGEDPVPVDCDEALLRAADELKVPTTIRVDLGKKYPEILGCSFDTKDEDDNTSKNLKDIDEDIPF